jgi:glutamine cyclotransferase
MFTKTTLALALVLGTVSFAAAQDSDPNLLNRYPAYNMTKQVWSQGLQTRSAALGHATGEHAQFDRASWSTGQ